MQLSEFILVVFGRGVLPRPEQKIRDETYSNESKVILQLACMLISTLVKSTGHHLENLWP